jgi:hypothetical protein
MNCSHGTFRGGTLTSYTTYPELQLKREKQMIRTTFIKGPRDNKVVAWQGPECKIKLRDS